MTYNRLKPGKRTREWERVRRELKKRFERAGITTCEFNYQDCWYNNGLSFAHIDKRRYLTPEQLYYAALACAVCHKILEAMPRLEMRERVSHVIARRENQP